LNYVALNASHRRLLAALCTFPAFYPRPPHVVGANVLIVPVVPVEDLRAYASH